MATKVRAFRSLIFLHFDSESELASSIGWPRQRLNKITNGEKIPTLDELEVLAEHLSISVGELADIFLQRKSSIGQQQNCANHKPA